MPPSGGTVQYAANYSYDALNRPVTVSWAPAPAQAMPTAGTAAFNDTYDRTNRRLTQTATDSSWWLYPSSPSTVTYTPNALNQYSAVGAVSLTYDGNGNLTYDGIFTYAYDADNRLTSVQQGANTVATYAYDAQGRRKTKTVGGTTTVYVTDADNREVLEYDGSSGAIQRWYSYGLGPDTVLNQMNVPAATRTTLLPDVQGSIIGTLDSGTGTLTETGYLPYGENPANLGGTFRYTGRRLDPKTGGNTAQPSGLYYYRARMYSPTWGRFLQPDPVGYAAGNNLYAYVGNDPLNLIDPLGLARDGPQNVGENFIRNGCPPGAPDCAINVGGTMTALIAGGASGSLIRTVGGMILRQFLPDASAPSGLGDLTIGEVNQIQSVVNQAGRPLEVVGSAARGQRTPTSDIDYVVPPSSIQHFEGLETKLPGLDPAHGVIPGTGNPNIGPVIRFEPQ